MGAVKALLIEQQEMDSEVGPCPSDFKTKKEWKEFIKPREPVKQRKSYEYEGGVPLSIHSLGDNAEAWLDDEPWRKW